jgi:hypothetical protein
VSAVRQTVDFVIDIVDDSINEKEEQFIVLVEVIRIANSVDTPEESERLFATVTIGIDPNEPDSQSLSHLPTYFYLSSPFSSLFINQYVPSISSHPLLFLCPSLQRPDC